MPLSDDRVERFRIRTRSYTKQIRKQDDEIKRNESKPAWIYPRTPDHAKDLLTKRIEAVLPHLQISKFNREWQAMNRNNKPSFAPLLCFAVDTLKLRSVRKVPEQQTESTIKRAQFLELFWKTKSGMHRMYLVKLVHRVNQQANSVKHHLNHLDPQKRHHHMQNCTKFTWIHLNHLWYMKVLK